MSPNGRPSGTVPAPSSVAWTQQLATLHARRDDLTRQLARLEAQTRQIEQIVSELTQARGHLERSATALTQVTLPTTVPPDDPALLRDYATAARRLAERLPDLLEDAALRADTLAGLLDQVPQEG